MDVLQMKWLAHLVSLQLVKVALDMLLIALQCLNQLGKDASAIGEATTPSKEHDLLIIISGSGSTEHLRLLAERPFSWC